MYHLNANVSLIVENETQIKTGMVINVGVSAKIWKNTSAKKIILEILLHVLNGKYLASTIDDSVIRCNEFMNGSDSVSTNVSANVMSTG